MKKVKIVYSVCRVTYNNEDAISDAMDEIEREVTEVLHRGLIQDICVIRPIRKTKVKRGQ